MMLIYHQVKKKIYFLKKNNEIHHWHMIQEKSIDIEQKFWKIRCIFLEGGFIQRLIKTFFSPSISRNMNGKRLYVTPKPSNLQKSIHTPLQLIKIRKQYIFLEDLQMDNTQVRKKSHMFLHSLNILTLIFHSRHGFFL